MRVLFVCTANICRSPAAEALARAQFGEQGRAFRSAGFLIPDQPCPDHMITSLAELGVDVSQHRSYQLNEPSLEAADIVLTMEGKHVQDATLIAPDTFHKIFPLKQAASILSDWSTVSVENFLAEANQSRDPRQYLDNRWDVADPYGGKLKGYKKAVQEIRSLVDGTLSRLS